MFCQQLLFAEQAAKSTIFVFFECLKFFQKNSKKCLHSSKRYGTISEVVREKTNRDKKYRGVAQFGRALRSGRRGRVFESRRFDSLAGAPGSLVYEDSGFLFSSFQISISIFLLRYTKCYTKSNSQIILQNPWISLQGHSHLHLIFAG